GVEAIEKSPALKAGIKAGDEILAIDGKSTLKMKVDGASKLIRGKAGTPLKLRLGRAWQNAFELKLSSASIQLPMFLCALIRELIHRFRFT
ncbi:PDZ domain-containing protein, partial [Trichormus variabilis FSR]|uniref:S41 family peptidase n=1 Tax=Anabaena variabilis TaxID=264691 RepID=UPI0016299598